MSKKWMAIVIVLAVALLSAAGVEAVQTPQEGFVPVENLPNQEQLPAAPLVAAAYGVAWGVTIFYVWTVWRRLGRVEKELDAVRARINAGAR